MLGGFAFQLMHVAGGRAIDGNSPRLHRLRNFPDQLDFQQSILEGGAHHLNIISRLNCRLNGARKYSGRDIHARSYPPCCLYRDKQLQAAGRSGATRAFKAQLNMGEPLGGGS